MGWTLVGKAGLELSDSQSLVGALGMSDVLPDPDIPGEAVSRTSPQGMAEASGSCKCLS